MALSSDTPRSYSWIGVENSLPVQASSTVYSGSALTIDTGGEVGPAATGEVNFAGFAVAGADNSSGSAGDINCRVLTEGEVLLTVAGVDDNDDIGDVCYASDDGTFTLTAGSNKAIGRVSQIGETSGTARVRFKSAVLEHALD